MAKIIILNAPPGAGKDTIGWQILEHSSVPLRHLSFKAPMFNIAQAMLGPVDYPRFIQAYDDRSQKEKGQSFLNGKSPREFMIWISEKVIKPEFGKQHFGKLFNDAAASGGETVICTDGGFPDEIIALINAGHDVRLCRLHRSGYTFEGDSRNYIHLNPYHTQGKTYQEKDYILVNGDPLHTVNEIIADHLK